MHTIIHTTIPHRLTYFKTDLKKRAVHFLILLAAFVPSCFGQQVTGVEVRELKKKGDSLIISYRMQVNARAVTSGQGLRVSPVLEVGNSLLSLPVVTVLGRNKEKVLSRYWRGAICNFISPGIKSDTILSHRVVVPHTSPMDSARFYLYQEVCGYRGAKVLTVCMFESRVEPEARESYPAGWQEDSMVPQEEEKRIEHQESAYLSFPEGCSVILPGFHHNLSALQKIDDTIGKAISNTDATLLSLNIKGYASPEGTRITNERLAHERAAALKAYIKSKFNLSEELFEVSFVAEDWDGLAALLRASNPDDKDKALEAINSTGIPDSRKRVLKGIAGGALYRKIRQELFPGLRRVECRIDYVVTTKRTNGLKREDN